MKSQIVIDAGEGALGRVAGYAAKQALLGNQIVIVNCNNAVITGRKISIVEEYRNARARGGSTLKGPHFPKTPERIMKRTVRGMLSYKKGRGGDAFKKIICYNATPVEYEKSEKISLKKEFKVKTLKLKELSKRM